MTDESLHSDQSHDKKIAALAKQLKDRSMSVDDYLSEDEWAQFLQTQDAADPGQDASYQPVYNATLGKSKRRKTTIFTGLTILVLGLGIYFLMQAVRKPAAQLSWQHRNVTKEVEKITLPDNTSVLLYPNSEIAYEGNFRQKNRDVKLTGHSEFTVTQHESKPFTVYCRGVATTVLGTHFSVNGENEHVSVHLFDGKVLVRGIKDSTVKYYLNPGETVTYLENENRFLVEGATKLPGAKKPAKPVIVKSPSTQKPRLEFQNEQLSDIFDYLAEKYNVEIRYPTDAALSTNVLLSIDAAQPVERILDNICRANSLKITKTSDRIFTITK